MSIFNTLSSILLILLASGAFSCKEEPISIWKVKCLTAAFQGSFLSRAWRAVGSENGIHQLGLSVSFAAELWQLCGYFQREQGQQFSGQIPVTQLVVHTEASSAQI